MSIPIAINGSLRMWPLSIYLHDHSVGTLANIGQVCVPRCDLKQLSTNRRTCCIVRCLGHLRFRMRKTHTRTHSHKHTRAHFSLNSGTLAAPFRTLGSQFSWRLSLRPKFGAVFIYRTTACWVSANFWNGDRARTLRVHTIGSSSCG